MVKRAAFESIGGFDAGFSPVWFEDVDLCRRLTRTGRTILHVPRASFTHVGGGSVRRLRPDEYQAAWYGNLHRYARKHHGPAGAALVRALTVPGAGLRAAGSLLQGDAGGGGRTARAAAFLRVAARSVAGWPDGSPFIS